MARLFARGHQPRLSMFDLSHEHKLSCGMGTLIPVLCTEVIPGDTLSLNSDLFLRLMPLAAPMMQRVDVFVHYFFVPTRLIWRNFDRFLTGGPDGTETIEHPRMPSRQMTFVTRAPFTKGTLVDYFGLPVVQQSDGNVTYPEYSTLPFRAYNLIYNDWYRDETLQQPLTVLDTDGTDGEDPNLYKVRRRAWKKGYFEAALPWTQRGPGATVPLEGQLPVTAPSDGVILPLTDDLTNHGAGWEPRTSTRKGILVRGNAVDSQTIDAYRTDGTLSEAAQLYGAKLFAGQSGGQPAWDASSTQFGDVPDFTGMIARGDFAGISLQSLRLAAAIQQFQERNARGGIRYIEWLRSHFGVISSDARLQRPEYLGGGKSPIVIGEVLQTSESLNTPQGWMAGQAVSAQRSLGFKRSFEEFGFVIGIMSIMPKASYEQGLPRMFTRFGRYDQILPEFSGIGDQAIKNKELYAFGSSPDGDFGYVPRFEECRRLPSTVHGEFHVSAGGTLGYWHLGRYFENEPTLNAEFVECQPSDRVFAVQDGSDKCLVDIHHNISALRPLPLNGVPGMTRL